MGRKVVNVVNFVRGIEPRCEMDLYTPTAEELRINVAEGLPHTFLLQYDALVRDDFKRLFLSNDSQLTELGVWFENCRELVEGLGLKWDGREGYDWDWYVHPGFLPGYDPADRERIVDAVFGLFKQIFGYYPEVVGSWILDSHSIEYMTKKYDVKAFCICREQHAVDAYTLWGGYYSGAYFPSRNNALSPAQTPEAQVDAPVFRMLGVDPVINYDDRLRDAQCVRTIEPVYECGREKESIEWFFRTYFDNPSLEFSEFTVGQENSFGWENIREGYLNQVDTIKRRIADGLIVVEKLGDTGKRFIADHKSTPASALCATEGDHAKNLQSYWYNCAFYRANLFVEDGKLFLRDAFKFDDRYEERYLKSGTTGFDAWYDTLPVIDGCLWSTKEKRAGVFCERKITKIDVTERDGKLVAAVEYVGGESGEIEFCESAITVKGSAAWAYETGTHDQSEAAEYCGHVYENRGAATIEYDDGAFNFEHNGFKYSVAVTADVNAREGGYDLTPKDGVIAIRFDLR